jgi:hypothetical protein
MDAGAPALSKSSPWCTSIVPAFLACVVTMSRTMMSTAGYRAMGSRGAQSAARMVGVQRDTPQKCHFTLGFCMLNVSIAGCPKIAKIKMCACKMKMVLIINSETKR